VKNVVQIAVSVHTRLHDLTTDVVGLHCLDLVERRPNRRRNLT